MGILGLIFSRAERHSTVLFFAIFMYRYPRCTGKQSANASPLPRDEAGDGRSLDCWAPSPRLEMTYPEVPTHFDGAQQSSEMSCVGCRACFFETTLLHSLFALRTPAT